MGQLGTSCCDEKATGTPSTCKLGEISQLQHGENETKRTAVGAAGAVGGRQRHKPALLHVKCEHTGQRTYTPVERDRTRVHVYTRVCPLSRAEQPCKDTRQCYEAASGNENGWGASSHPRSVVPSQRATQPHAASSANEEKQASQALPGPARVLTRARRRPL